NTLYAQTWNWSTADTENPLAMNFNALTSGTGVGLVSTATALTGSLQSITLTGTNVANTGNLLYLNSSGTASIAKALNVAIASTGNFSTTGGVAFNFNGAHTGTGLVLSDVTTTGTAMAINTTALTSGTGLYLNGTSATAVTGNLLNVYSVSTAAPTNGLVRFNFNGIRTAAGTAFQIDDISTTLATTMKVNSNSLTTGTAANINVNALTSGTGLSVVGTGTGVTGNMFLVQSASTGSVTNGLGRFNFTGAHTGTGLLVSDVTTTGTAMAINTTALTSGTGLYLNGTSATAVTGNLLNVYSVSTAAPTNGLVRFNFNGIRTAAGTAFQIDDISTTLATTMKVNSNSLTTGTAANINVNALTSGTGLSVVGTGTGVTGNMFLVQSASTGAATNGLARFNFTGAHTGNGVQINDVTTTGTAMAINTTALTSGTGLYLNGTSATAVTGNLLNVYSVSTAAPTNGLVRFNFNGIRTAAGTAFQIDDISTTLATTMKVNSNSLTTGTAANINVNALTSGTGLSVVGTGTGVTGNMFLVQSASTGAASNGLARLYFSGAHTGNGLQIDDATATGTAMALNANSVTTGKALSISGNALTTGSLVSIASTSTAAGSNTQTLLDIALSGTNGTSAQTTYGLKVANTHAGTTSTNIGAYFTASGGTTANYGLLVANGDVGIGTTAPQGKLEIVAGADFNAITLGYNVSDANNNGAIISGKRKTQANIPFSGFATWDDGANRTLYMGGGGWARPDAMELLFFTAAAYNETNNQGVERMRITKDGDVGIGTTAPAKRLDVFEAVSEAQLRVSYSGSVYSEIYTDSAGDVRMSATGGDIRVLDENFWVCSGGACASITPSGNGNIIAEGGITIGVSSATCDSSNRGTTRVEQGSTGVTDKLWVCLKTSSDTYNWVLVARGD
ncbi:MAG TPA: hypothetical protein P5080_05830, partial [Candidatus Paceibacterota bacterium]|nr:hypothetical protein [Candidatus Paceibacterota bacterium]